MVEQIVLTTELSEAKGFDFDETSDFRKFEKNRKINFNS